MGRWAYLRSRDQILPATNKWQPYDDVTQNLIRDALGRGDKVLKLSISGSSLILLILRRWSKQNENGFVRRIRRSQMTQQLAVCQNSLFLLPSLNSTFRLRGSRVLATSRLPISNGGPHAPMYDHLAGKFAETLFSWYFRFSHKYDGLLINLYRAAL